MSLPDRPADPARPNVDEMRTRLERLQSSHAADRAEKVAKAGSN